MIWMLVSLQQLSCTILPSRCNIRLYSNNYFLKYLYYLIEYFERSITLKCTICSGADTPDWKPKVPTNNYGLNMCSMLSAPDAGALTLTDAGCATNESTIGYVCEYG